MAIKNITKYPKYTPLILFFFRKLYILSFFLIHSFAILFFSCYLIILLFIIIHYYSLLYFIILYYTLFILYYIFYQKPSAKTKKQKLFLHLFPKKNIIFTFSFCCILIQSPILITCFFFLHLIFYHIHTQTTFGYFLFFSFCFIFFIFFHSFYFYTFLTNPPLHLYTNDTQTTFYE